ncbi:hypothetical protein OG21DRAFT_1417386 [Imleria badia]|nr:hypothetical protein OG21DRAFT_1417386 [Imleria badia]
MYNREARLSMIAAIIRITNPCASIQRMSYAIAIAFGAMWIAMLAQKLYICGTRLCTMTHGVAISQLITDGISDTFLVSMPIFFLKGVKISWSQRVLLVSSVSSSFCITILSIAQSVTLFLPITRASLLVTQIKAALSVVICNLRVVVTFAYRVYRKTDIDLSGCSIKSEPIQFTTVIPRQVNLGSCSCPTSLPSPCNYCISSSVPERRQTMCHPCPSGLIHNPTTN